MDTPPVLTVNLETAESYFMNRLHANVWSSASEEDKRKALAWGAEIIRNGFLWEDGAYSETGEWVTQVINGVCEEALWLLKTDPSEYPTILTKGLASGNAGAVSATFSKEFIAPMVCPMAVSLIGVFGTLNNDESGTIKSTMLGG